MVSEVGSILAAASGAFVALWQSKRRSALPRRETSLSIAVCLFDLAVLSFSSLLRKGDDVPSAVHTVAGHLMLPLVATAAGLWSGGSFPGIWRQPFEVLPRALFLLVLCFCCLSNTWTGYLGPSRIDPAVEPDTIIRFKVIHQWVVPVLIGTMLLFWLSRIVFGGSPAAKDVPH